MSSASSATAEDPGILLSATHAAQQVKSAGELTLITMRKSGTRVMTRQSQVDFVPRRGIMLRIDPHFLLLYFLYSFCCHMILM